MTHVPGTWATAAASLFAAVEHRRANRDVAAVAILELVIDDDGTPSVVIQHAVATGFPASSASVLREFGAALVQAAEEQETQLQ